MPTYSFYRALILWVHCSSLAVATNGELAPIDSIVSGAPWHCRVATLHASGMREGGVLFIQLLSLIKLVEWKKGMAGRRRGGRVLCSLVMALSTWQETNWDVLPALFPLPSTTLLDCHISLFFFLFKFSYVHPPPKLACLMSNSKVCISLRAFLLVFPFSETSQTLNIPPSEEWQLER